MKIVYLCHFSNTLVRKHLLLKKWVVRNAIRSVLHREKQSNGDYAVWNTDFINEFEKSNELEFHIVSPHRGMWKQHQHFTHNGIFYHFFKDDGSVLWDLVNAKFRIEKRSEYKTNRERIRKIINQIKPDLLILCGAECTSFSIAALDYPQIPMYVLLQTVANQPKFIEMGIGSDYIRNIERRIFLQAKYLGTPDIEYFTIVNQINPNIVCLPINFPSHVPPVFEGVKKQYDFAFFGRVTVNKGIQDVIDAFAIVAKKHPGITLNIIGACVEDYKEKLKKKIAEYQLTDNVIFSGYFSNMDDMYKEVQSANIVVVPGITATLNSTVRESMLMRMPTIVYETDAAAVLNKEKECLFMARMKDVKDLSEKMLRAFEDSNFAQEVANNGYEYATLHFSNKEIGERMTMNIKAIINYEKNHSAIPDELVWSLN